MTNQTKGFQLNEKQVFMLIGILVIFILAGMLESVDNTDYLNAKVSVEEQIDKCVTDSITYQSYINSADTNADFYYYAAKRDSIKDELVVLRRELLNYN